MAFFFKERSLTYSSFAYFQSVQYFLHPYQTATSMVQVMFKARAGGLAVTMVILLLATKFYSVPSREFGVLVFLHVWEVTDNRLNSSNNLQRSRITPWFYRCFAAFSPALRMNNVYRYLTSRSSWIVMFIMALFISGCRGQFWFLRYAGPVVRVSGWKTRSEEFYFPTHSLSVHSASQRPSVVQIGALYFTERKVFDMCDTKWKVLIR